MLDISIAIVHLLQELTDTDMLQDSEVEANILVEALVSQFSISLVFFGQFCYTLIQYISC